MAKLQFEPEIELSPSEQGALVVMAASEGFKVQHRIIRSVVDGFIINLINQDTADDAAVLAAHKLAKAAAVVYDSVTSRINSEISLYNAANIDDLPIDDTAKNLDIGPEATTQYDIDLAIDASEEGPF